MNTTLNEQPKISYWHRELPPPDASPIGEHTVEATSARIPDTVAGRDKLWDLCTDDLMIHVRERLAEEVSRLGGRYAHVLDESMEMKHDASTGEAWLHGRFTYVLYQ